jgi:hypothetical protein
MFLIPSKRTGALLVGLLMTAGSACSFDDPTSDAPAASAPGLAEKDGGSGGGHEASEADEAGTEKKKRGTKKNGDRPGEERGSSTGGSTDKKSVAGPDGGSGGEDAVAGVQLGGEMQRPRKRPPRPSGPAAKVSRVRDPAPDAETRGDAPSYVEITEASIAGHPDSAVFSISVAGKIPKKMPDNDTVTYVSFALQRKDRTYSVNASCERDGWRANVNGGRSFPGAFSISGKTLTMSVPWESVGGKKGFDWRADSSWTRSSLVDTHYGLDSAPNDRDKRYR